MPQQVHTDWFTEIGLSISGTYQPGCKAWRGSRFEPPTNPPEAPMIEDMAIDAMFVTVSSYQNGLRKSRQIDLLAGVDRKSPGVQKLLSNILAHCARGVEDELIGLAADDASEAA